jgi:hypothetical protein
MKLYLDLSSILDFGYVDLLFILSNGSRSGKITIYNTHRSLRLKQLHRLMRE